jgi:hypothetical protein
MIHAKRPATPSRVDRAGKLLSAESDFSNTTPPLALQVARLNRRFGLAQATARIVPPLLLGEARA